ncbi:hypothetical protein L218DRAFT_993248 [Marasmius fiardii PR-910]|nr:hypothetical protein L218DRAFT_993248 [Marasmius fiardii PR-910]
MSLPLSPLSHLSLPSIAMLPYTTNLMRCLVIAIASFILATVGLWLSVLGFCVSLFVDAPHKPALVRAQTQVQAGLKLQREPRSQSSPVVPRPSLSTESLPRKSTERECNGYPEAQIGIFAAEGSYSPSSLESPPFALKRRVSFEKPPSIASSTLSSRPSLRSLLKRCRRTSSLTSTDSAPANVNHVHFHCLKKGSKTEKEPRRKHHIATNPSRPRTQPYGAPFFLPTPDSIYSPRHTTNSSVSSTSSVTSGQRS